MLKLIRSFFKGEGMLFVFYFRVVNCEFLSSLRSVFSAITEYFLDYKNVIILWFKLIWNGLSKTSSQKSTVKQESLTESFQGVYCAGISLSIPIPGTYYSWQYSQSIIVRLTMWSLKIFKCDALTVYPHTVQFYSHLFKKGINLQE